MAKSLFSDTDFRRGFGFIAKRLVDFTPFSTSDLIEALQPEFARTCTISQWKSCLLAANKELKRLEARGELSRFTIAFARSRPAHPATPLFTWYEESRRWLPLMDSPRLHAALRDSCLPEVAVLPSEKPDIRTYWCRSRGFARLSNFDRDVPTCDPGVADLDYLSDFECDVPTCDPGVADLDHACLSALSRRVLLAFGHGHGWRCNRNGGPCPPPSPFGLTPMRGALPAQYLDYFHREFLAYHHPRRSEWDWGKAEQVSGILKECYPGEDWNGQRITVNYPSGTSPWAVVSILDRGYGDYPIPSSWVTYIFVHDQCTLRALLPWLDLRMTDRVEIWGPGPTPGTPVPERPGLAPRIDGEGR